MKRINFVNKVIDYILVILLVMLSLFKGGFYKSDILLVSMGVSIISLVRIIILIYNNVKSKNYTIDIISILLLLLSFSYVLPIIFNNYADLNSSIYEAVRYFSLYFVYTIVKNSDNKKIYVFDIKQTYGRDYNKWNYSHYVDNAILKYYQTELNVKNDNSKSFNENFYDIIYKISFLKIVDDYKDTTAEEVKFIAKTMASLFLSKSNFNIYTLPNVYEELNQMENEDILKCMQISNRETTILYNDFINDVNNLENIQNYIQTRILFLLKENGVINESEKQDIISGIDNNSVFNYDILEFSLKSFIRSFILKYLSMEDVDNIVKDIYKKNSSFSNKELLSMIDKKRSQLDKVYLDKLEGVINENMYKRISLSINNELIKLEKENSLKSPKIDINLIMENFLNLNFSRNLVRLLVKKIEVYNDKKVKLYLNF